MGFPVDLTSVLTGASISQLHHWRKHDVLVPEVSPVRTIQYSFRDLVALRSFVRLRKHVSLQKIRKALRTLRQLDLTEHPSRYTFLTDGRTVVLDHDGTETDLVGHPGQKPLLSLRDVFEPFETRAGRPVVDFLHPRPHLEVRERRLGGWPTIEHTRVRYDTVALLLEGGDVSFDDVGSYYPSVTPAAGRDAVDFDEEVRAVNRRRAA